MPIVGEIGERQGVGRIALQQVFDDTDRLEAICTRKSPDMPVRAHHPLLLAELGYVLALRALNFSGHDARRDGANDAVGNLILHNENIFERTVVAVSPDMVTGGGVDELCRDTRAVSGLPYAALEHISHAELAAD